MTTPPPPIAYRRTALIIWGALLVGVLMFAAVASFVGPGLRRGGAHGPDVLVHVALGLTAACVFASRVVPPRLRPAPGVAPEAFAITRTILGAALCEGAGLFGIVAWMLTGSPWAALAVAVAVAGIVATFPGEARWRALVGETPRQRGPDGPSRMVR